MDLSLGVIFLSNRRAGQTPLCLSGGSGGRKVWRVHSGGRQARFGGSGS